MTYLLPYMLVVAIFGNPLYVSQNVPLCRLEKLLDPRTSEHRADSNVSSRTSGRLNSWDKNRLVIEKV